MVEIRKFVQAAEANALRTAEQTNQTSFNASKAKILWGPQIHHVLDQQGYNMLTRLYPRTFENTTTDFSPQDQRENEAYRALTDENQKSTPANGERSIFFHRGKGNDNACIVVVTSVVDKKNELHGISFFSLIGEQYDRKEAKTLALQNQKEEYANH